MKPRKVRFLDWLQGAYIGKKSGPWVTAYRSNPNLLPEEPTGWTNLRKHLLTQNLTDELFSSAHAAWIAYYGFCHKRSQEPSPEPPVNPRSDLFAPDELGDLLDLDASNIDDFGDLENFTVEDLEKENTAMPPEDGCVEVYRRSMIYNLPTESAQSLKVNIHTGTLTLDDFQQLTRILKPGGCLSFIDAPKPRIIIRRGKRGPIKAVKVLDDETDM